MICLPRASRVPLALIAAMACVAGCNQRMPVLDNPVLITAPTGWNNATVPNGPGGDLARLDVSPSVMIGGGGGRGTVWLDGPAPDGGLVVSLASSVSGVASVAPPTVTIPPGGFSANFSFTTNPVARDAAVSIIASSASRSRSASLGVWAAMLPSFYFHVTDQPTLLRVAPFNRVTSDMGATFDVSCSGNVVHGTVTPPGQSSHSVTFAAAAFQPLRPGVYENATANGSGHHLRIGVSLSCASAGRFEVRQFDAYPSGAIANLWVAFETGCPGVPGVVRGEFRATNLRQRFNRPTCIAIE